MSDPKNALEKFTLHATELIGSKVKKCAMKVQNGDPGGCGIPQKYAAVTNSPESPNNIDGGSEIVKTIREIINTKSEQRNIRCLKRVGMEM